MSTIEGQFDAKDALGIRAVATRARRAGRAVAALEADARAGLLTAIADALADPSRREELLTANARDMVDARAAEALGKLDSARVRRLALSPAKLDALCDGLRQLAAAPELLGTATLQRELDDGLLLERAPCPLGTLGVVFEARPDAVPQIAGLALKTGNALLLKGGSEALQSNRALTALLHDVLRARGLDPGVIALLEQREEIAAMLELDDCIDLVIARGSGSFVQYVQRNTKIPVLGHAEGLCHLYLHDDAEAEMAARIAVDAKCSYPAACNAIETLLWTPGARAALVASARALLDQGVTLRVCPQTRAALASERAPLELTPASAEDWHTEYGSLTLSIRQVSGLDEALQHIETYGSRHTEAIITGDEAIARRFLAEVDAAGVFHNASTRFADGYRYGLGAEVGISTGKLHARGPVGVEGLVTYRWLLRGRGQVASDYGPGKRPFLHRTL